MAHRVEEEPPFAGEQAVDQDEAGHRIDDVVIADIQPPWPGDPAEVGVEDEKPDKAEPEDRDRIAEQTDDADHLILPPSLIGGGDDAERHAERNAEDRRQGGELERRREEAHDISEHRVRGQHRSAEIAVQHLGGIEVELLIERQIEAELDARALIDIGGGAIADDGEHRIDRHDTADQEGHEQQTEEGDSNDNEDAGHTP